MQKEHAQTTVLYSAWGVALLATLGSLYFSEIKHYAPCVLCWWQRICFYPLALILAIAILRKDLTVYLYALPLAFAGAGIGLYQVLLQAGIIPERLAPCVSGVSCLTKYDTGLGFLTIPLLSFLGFCGIIILMFIYKKLGRLQQ